MWLIQVAALLAAFVLTSGEISDVTTIYNLDSEQDYNGDIIGRVYSRIDALGIPIITGEDEKELKPDPEHLYSNLTCDVNGVCSWVPDTNWALSPVAYRGSEITPGKRYVVTKWTNIRFQSIVNFDDEDPVYFYIKKYESSRDNALVVCKSSIIEIYSQCSQYYNYYNYGPFYLRYANQESDLNIRCNNKDTSTEFDSKNGFISFNVSDNYFQIFKGMDLVTSFNCPYTPLFTLYHGRIANKPKLIRFSLSGLNSTINGAEMLSPLITLQKSRKVCLSLSVYSQEDTKQDVLLLLAKDLYEDEYLLQRVNNVKAGWNNKQLDINIDKNIRQPFTLVLRSLKEGIQIMRITTCNSAGEEVWATDPVNKQSLLIQYSEGENKWRSNYSFIYKPKWTVTAESRINNVTYDCKNGGVKTEDGCACPPGFMGNDCQVGCGPNRFGKDCGGLCSLRTSMCTNLLMCNNKTGCHCAPGYKGRLCRDSCSGGFYGNDCDQICGRCLNPTKCDVYTGECQMCKPGYSLPYCKQATVYYILEPELSSFDFGSITIRFYNKNTYFAGVGQPVLYQVQYKEKSQYDWSIFTSKKLESSDRSQPMLQETNDEEGLLNSSIEETIEGLKTGYKYEVRILLLDTDFNKYDGDLVKESEIVTKCEIPETYDYNITAETTASSIAISWMYNNETEHWCPVEEYEVSWKEGWKWKTIMTNNQQFFLENLLPNSSIEFIVRAKTSTRFAPSGELVVSTLQEGTSKVGDLHIVGRYSTSAKLSWSPPKNELRQLIYKISYTCDEQLACSPGCVNATEGTLTQEQTSVTLSPLLPFTKYKVTVTPEGGPDTSIYVGTLETVPTELPILSSEKILRTNRSLTVVWDSPVVCSGFLQGYRYHLHKEKDTTKILASGFTKSTNATFNNLSASTEYMIRVFVETIGGWNPDAFLDIIASTSATVPDAVKNLTVYKRSRNSLSLRWAPPTNSYGALKSFTVGFALNSERTSQTIDLTPCVPWPNLYCYTLLGLMGNRRYSVFVSARNIEVAEDGAVTSVIGMTKESLPAAPEGLKLVNSTSTSLSLEWCYPDLANGIIRSFLVSVEETDQYNQDNCCQVYPLVEAPVQEELPSYRSEVSGLHPASTYFVSVSAKTVGLGPSQSFVVHTKPPHMTFSTLPDLKDYDSTSWLPQEPQPLPGNATDTYKSLIKAYILIIVDGTGSDQTNDSGISKPQLNSLLQDIIAKPFYFYTEYSQEDTSVNLTQNPDQEFAESEWGTCLSPYVPIEPGRYQLVAVQITEYNSQFNVDLRFLSKTIF